MKKKCSKIIPQMTEMKTFNKFDCVTQFVAKNIDQLPLILSSIKKIAYKNKTQ